MKILTNNELKRLNKDKLQELIVDFLSQLSHGTIIGTKTRSVAEMVLKAYLLECGESIDVDFSDKPSNEDPDNKKMIRDDVFYSDFSERIKNIMK